MRYGREGRVTAFLRNHFSVCIAEPRRRNVVNTSSTASTMARSGSRAISPLSGVDQADGQVHPEFAPLRLAALPADQAGADALKFIFR